MGRFWSGEPKDDVSPIVDLDPQEEKEIEARKESRVFHILHPILSPCYFPLALEHPHV
jgi:hypothetical protein